MLVVVAAAVALAIGAASSPAKSNAAFKAAWIYVGPHNDGGWSQAHDQGRLAVVKALGSKVQTTFKENVPEGPQVAQVINQLIRDGNKIIFATSFGFQPAMAAAAKKNPDVKFEMATGTTILPNMSEYYGAGEDAIYHWGTYDLKRVKAAMNGTWKTGNYYGSMKDGFTLLAPYGSHVSAATKKLIAKQKALIVSGKWNEFQGPIYDQSGKLRIKPGQRPSFNDLYSMNYLVKGVIGSAKG